MSELECHHFANPDEIVYLGSIPLKLLKPLGKRLRGNFIVDGSG